MSAKSRPLSANARRREKLLQSLQTQPPKQAAAEQLELFRNFAAEMPGQFTALFELYDAVPKFFAGAVTSLTAGAPLPVVRREFKYNGAMCEVEIAPTVLSSKNQETGESIRKEVLPGEREECIWLVARRMASDPAFSRGANDKGPYVTCSLSQIRRQLEEIGRGWRIWEIREALEVLDRTPLKVFNTGSKKLLYSGSYLSVQYMGDPEDRTGERTMCRITLNALAATALYNGLYDRIHYLRFALLRSSLARWLYERIVLNFRQADMSQDSGYLVTLSLIIRESPIRNTSRPRRAMEEVRAALEELGARREAGTPGPVLSPLRPYVEEIKHGESRGGRKPIADVHWTLFPSSTLVDEIRASNAAKLARETAGTDAPRLR